LDASGTDNPEHLELNYSWDINVNGSWVNGVSTDQTATLDFMQLQSLGIDAIGSPYQVRVEVTEPVSGITHISDPTNLFVDPGFTPNAGGPYEIVEGQTLDLDASETDNPENLDLNYSWDINVNGSWVNGVATGQTAILDPTHLQNLGIDAASSPYQVRVEVTDTADNITLLSDSTDLVVNSTFAPDAGGPYQISEGQSLDLDASNTSNPNNLPLSYSWDINVNGNWIDNVATGQTATVDPTLLQFLGINAANSPYEVRVEVTDTNDGTAITSDAVDLTVNPVFSPYAGGPYQIMVGQPLVLNASGTYNPNSLPLTYSWDINVNGNWINGVTIGQQAVLFPPQLQSLGIDAAGSPYQVLVEVTDPNDGITLYSDPTSLTVTAAQPSFSNLSAPTIIYGTATTTISGHLNSNSAQAVLYCSSRNRNLPS
jgi:hypothetical protein